MATPPVPPPVPGAPKVPTPLSAPPVPPPGSPVQPMQSRPTVDEAAGEQMPIERSFWQIPFVQDVLPFLTSLVVHLGLILLGWLTYQTAQIIVQATREPMVIPSEVIIEGAEVGGIPNPGLGGEDRPAMQDQFKDVSPESTGINDKPSTSLTNSLIGGGSGEGEDNMIAVGAAAGGFGKGRGLGSGLGEGTGSGSGDGGPLAPFGAPGGGMGIGPKSPFMGVSGNAMRVAYVCDSSGSMMNLFDTLRMELRKAVDTLKPIQSFNIVFFSEDNFVALDKSGQLLLAVPENKRKAYEFLDKTAPHGSSDPIPGLRLAFQNQPQLIYMLTDGDFPNNAQIIEELRKLNANKKVKINTIAFGGDAGDPYHQFLDQIAKEHGGMFKHVREADLRN